MVSLQCAEINGVQHDHAGIEELPATEPDRNIGWTVNSNIDPDIVRVEALPHHVSHFLKASGMRDKDAEICVWYLIGYQAPPKR